MTPFGQGDSRGLGRRLAVIGAVVAGMAMLVIAVGRPSLGRSAARTHGPAMKPIPPVAPIAAEADVFRTRASMMANDLSDVPTRPAHPRTLVTYRRLRANPGAPPRIPHGLTREEFRTVTCNACHARGGYAPRFSAYVPVTPHPERAACLQCHVANDEVTAVTLPDGNPNSLCRQCHALNGTRHTESPVRWRPMPWPRLAAASATAPPPPIPHDLAFRGNCLACHGGPAAVAEIRTTHPERADCRQCHVLAGEAEVAVTGAGGGPS